MTRVLSGQACLFQQIKSPPSYEGGDFRALLQRNIVKPRMGLEDDLESELGIKRFARPDSRRAVKAADRG